MSKKLVTKDYTFSVRTQSISHVRTHKNNNDGSSWLEGTILTANGAVDAYSQGDEKWAHSSRFDYVFNGIVYVRQVNRRYTSRGLTRFANKFAKEMYEKLS